MKALVETPRIIAYAPEYGINTAKVHLAFILANGEWAWREARVIGTRADLLESLRALAVDTLYGDDEYKDDLADLCRQLDDLIDEALAAEFADDED